MIVMAGTFYRMRNVAKALTRMQMKDLLVKMGTIYQSKPETPAMLPKVPKSQPGEW